MPALVRNGAAEAWTLGYKGPPGLCLRQLGWFDCQRDSMV